MTKFILLALIPLSINASVTPRRKYTQAELYAIKEKMDYGKYQEITARRMLKKKKLVRYKPIVVPHNSPDFKGNERILPVPEIEITFEEFKK